MGILNFLSKKIIGSFMGQDEFGNKYYENKYDLRTNNTPNRWVEYNGANEPSKIPSKWFNWLHYQENTPPISNKKSYAWEKKFTPNLTGTEQAYFPPGHKKAKNKREKSIGDYESWSG